MFTEENIFPVLKLNFIHDISTSLSLFFDPTDHLLHILLCAELQYSNLLVTFFLELEFSDLSSMYKSPPEVTKGTFGNENNIRHLPGRNRSHVGMIVEHAYSPVGSIFLAMLDPSEDCSSISSSIKAFLGCCSSVGSGRA